MQPLNQRTMSNKMYGKILITTEATAAMIYDAENMREVVRDYLMLADEQGYNTKSKAASIINEAADFLNLDSDKEHESTDGLHYLASALKSKLSIESIDLLTNILKAK